MELYTTRDLINSVTLQVPGCVNFSSLLRGCFSISVMFSDQLADQIVHAVPCGRLIIPFYLLLLDQLSGRVRLGHERTIMHCILLVYYILGGGLMLKYMQTVVYVCVCVC